MISRSPWRDRLSRLSPRRPRASAAGRHSARHGVRARVATAAAAVLVAGAAGGVAVAGGYVTGGERSVSPSADRPQVEASPGVTFGPAEEVGSGTNRKPGKRAKRLRDEVEALAAVGPTTFRVASFNVLGHGHTAKGGNRKGWASSQHRMSLQVQALNGHAVNVVGFQEFQRQQAEAFARMTGGGWGVFPGVAGGRSGVRNSIAWRHSDWTLKESHTIPIPYFGGSPLPMPYVLLQHKETGRQVWFANFHNPSDARGPAAGLRARAAQLQVNLVNRLLSSTKHPVIVTGDMNDRAAYFCTMTGGAPMHSASGGSNSGGCRPPARMFVDWIFGSQHIEFSKYTADLGPLVRRSSDHPLVVATASIDPDD